MRPLVGPPDHQARPGDLRNRERAVGGGDGGLATEAGGSSRDRNACCPAADTTSRSSTSARCCSCGRDGVGAAGPAGTGCPRAHRPWAAWARAPSVWRGCARGRRRRRRRPRPPMNRSGTASGAVARLDLRGDQQRGALGRDVEAQLGRPGRRHRRPACPGRRPAARPRTPARAAATAAGTRRRTGRGTSGRRGQGGVARRRGAAGRRGRAVVAVAARTARAAAVRARPGSRAPVSR